MKQKQLNAVVFRLRICVITFILAILSLFIFSFTTIRISEEFFKQLGIEKKDADKKITNSLLKGYLDAYGLKNIKNISSGNRRAVIQDLLEYTYNYTRTESFKKEYSKLKLENKPMPFLISTPEELRSDMIESYRKSIMEMEAAAAKADGNTKAIFEKAVADSKKQLKEAEDPDNKMIATYAKSYKQLLESGQKSYEQQIVDWELKFPENEMLFIKQRLSRFLEETKDIDFNAVLIGKNGKMIFANPDYESRNRYWKMGFRAGKEVVEPAREFVTKWVNEIN